MRINIDGKLEKDIMAYCEANGITDVRPFALRCLVNGFNVLKYGTSPIDNKKRESEGITDYEEPKAEKVPQKVARKKIKIVSID